MDAVEGEDATVEEVDVEVAMEFVSEDEDEETTYQPPTGVGVFYCVLYFTGLVPHGSQILARFIPLCRSPLHNPSLLSLLPLLSPTVLLLPLPILSPSFPFSLLETD